MFFGIHGYLRPILRRCQSESPFCLSAAKRYICFLLESLLQGGDGADADDLLRHQVGDQENDHEGGGEGVEVAEAAHGESLSQEGLGGFREVYADVHKDFRLSFAFRAEGCYYRLLVHLMISLI